MSLASEDLSPSFRMSEVTVAKRSVSVLIPTFNRASFLPGMLASIANQTAPPDEVILVDDGSTDGTAQVVESWVSDHGEWAKRLRYVHQSNGGKSAALNAALPLVGSEWIAFNDSDDTWHPEKLALQFEALDRFPECFAVFTETNLLEFNERNRRLVAQAAGLFGKVEHPSQLYPAGWPGTYMQTVLARADMVKACGGFDPLYRLSQDVDFLFRLGLQTSFCYVNAPLVVVDRSPQETRLTNHFPALSWTAMLEEESMLAKWLPMLDGSAPELRRVVRKALVDSRSALANRHALAGDLQRTRRVLREGMADTPALTLLAKLFIAYTAPPLLRQLARTHAPPELLQSDSPQGTSRIGRS